MSETMKNQAVGQDSLQGEREESLSQLRAFNESWHEIDQYYARCAARSGLSPTAFWILYELGVRGEGVTQQELAKALFLSRQTINSALNTLKKNGWIELREDPDNGRIRRIYFTKSGNAKVDEVVRPLIAHEDEVFLEMSPEEREALTRTFARYKDLLTREIPAALQDENS